MFEFIIDLFKAIFKSIFGNAQQRKTAGAVAFLTLLAITFGAFTAWVSQPRYKDILFGLTDGYAWGISIAIACGMSFGITKLAYDLYRNINHGVKLPGTFVPLFVLILLVGIFDCTKNFEGSEDRARFSNEIDKYANGAAKPYADDIAKLEKEKAEILKVYTWKGKVYFAETKYTKGRYAQDRARMDQIENSITDFERKQTAEINEYNSLRDERNSYGKRKSKKAHAGLWWMSLSVYFLQIIIGYFLVGAMDELDGQIDGELSFGIKAESGIISAIKEKLAPTPATAKKEPSEIGFKTLKPEILTPAKDDILKAILDKLDSVIVQSNEPFKGSGSGQHVDRSFLHGNFDKEDAEQGRKTRTERSIKKKEAAKELRQEGKTIPEIAKLLKCSQSSVKRYLKSN